MEVDVIESSKNKLVIDVKGEGHALCSTLKKELWQDKNVSVSGYFIEHPQVGIPRMSIETKGNETPQKALQDACKRLEKHNKEFLDKFKKEIK